MQTDSTRDEIRKLHFIHDEAATTDEFGSHDRVASAVAQVISEDHKLKVIGLLGPWGSGKSTVVSLVQQKLNDDSDGAKKIRSYVFTYDAWQHQNDPPRRAFLDTLIQFLVTQKLTEDKLWREKLDRLNRKIDDTTVTSTPMLTPSGKWILLSLLAVPFGQALITKASFKSLFHASGWTTFDGILCAIGIVLAIAPLIVAIGIYIAWRPTWNPRNPTFKTRGNWLQHKREHEESSILSIFMNRQITTNRNRVIREPDPTAIEFQNIFREIMEAVASVNGRYRFIFVIDNLDRLPEADAIAMWGTIRSFFLGAEETQALRKVTLSPTVLLPIDEKAVRAIFRGESEARANSFMDKTFDLSFRITQPVTSRWDTYLAKKMGSVFGSEMDREWPKIVSRFYLSSQTQNSGMPITPRGINKLVNDIATCWLQWHKTENISFAAIAYYCVFQVSIENNPVAEISSPRAGVTEIDPDWAQSVAAIHYGAKPEEAKQILIEQPLRNAIHNNNISTFEELSKIPGFGMVLLRIAEGWRAQAVSTPDEILLTVGLLDRMSLDDLSDLRQIKQILRLAIQSTSSWGSFSPEQSKALASLIPDNRGFGRSEFLAKMSEILRVALSGAAAAAKFPEAFVAFWAAAAKSDSGIGALPVHIYVPGDARNFFKVKLAFQGNDALSSRFATDADAGLALQGLASDTKVSTDAALAVQTARIAMEVYKEADWKPLVQELASYARDNGSNTPAVSAATQIIGLLRPTRPEAKAHIDLMIAGGQIANKLKLAYGQNDDAFAGTCLALFMVSDTDPVDPNPDTLAVALSERLGMLNALDKGLQEFRGEDDIVGFLYDAVTRSAAISGIAKRIFSHRVLHDRIGTLRTAQIIKNYDGYLAFLDADLVENFLKIFTGYGSFWKVMDDEPLGGNVTKIYKVLIACDDSSIQSFARQKLSIRLGTVDGDEWKAAIRSGASPYDIAADFANVLPETLGLTALWTPLNEMTDEVLQSTTHDVRVRWFVCASFLNDSGRKTLYHNVGEQITHGAAVAEVHELLELGGQSFIDEGGFAQASDQSVRRVVYPSLENQAGLESLLRWVSAVKGWVDDARAETREQLATLLIEQKSKSDPVLAERFAALYEGLALPPISFEIKEDGAGDSNPTS
ncbi:P-loop NTPase fold protein [Rhodanobacter hydrolyticus]|uniref:KAP NTPase domain-containing protein n=1 Tax=Rhodanobacter hydrolyticus TaxID=2250595 RepID=A0ABW8JDT8_9GAMM